MSAARGEPPDGAPQVAVSSAEGRNNSGPSLMVAKPGASTQTILRGQVSRRPLAMRVRVEGVRARPVGVRLKDDKVVVGSQPPCDLVLADSTVSRKHVELELVPEGVRVTDLGSHNGTYYLGQRIVEVTRAESDPAAWAEVAEFLDRNPSGRLIVVGESARDEMLRWREAEQQAGRANGPLRELAAAPRFLKPGRLWVMQQAGSEQVEPLERTASVAPVGAGR